MADTDRFARAIAAIDAGNADDPNIVTVGSLTGPKEIVHAALVTEWVEKLHPDPSEALLLAARGHHFRRWTMPRASAPAGRAGYLRWRRSLQEQHARELGTLLAAAGYDEATVGRVQAIVRKQGLATDPEVQALEDALCLVFLEAQLTDVAARLDSETLAHVIARTAAKMSEAGRAAIADVPLDEHARGSWPRQPGARWSSGISPASPRTTGRRLPPRSRPTSSASVRTATITAAGSRTRSSWPR